MRIAVCDDDALMLEQLQKHIRAYFEKACVKCPEIVCFSDGESLLSDKGEKDILFLDIEMPGINGIYVGNELKRQNENIIIFVVTSYSEYLDDAMRFHVFRYLSKPLDVHRFFRNIIFFAIFSKMIFFAIIYTLIHFLKGRQEYSQKRDKYTLLLVFIPLTSVYVMLAFIAVSEAYALSPALIFMVTLGAVFLLLTNLLVFGINQYNQKKNMEFTEMQLLLQKEANSAEYYAMLLSQNENQSILIHDIKKHLQSIGQCS